MSRDGFVQPLIAPPPPKPMTAAATWSTTAGGSLPASSTNAGFGALPVSNTFVRFFAVPTGANTACADLYDATAATAEVRSGLPTRDEKKPGSVSPSSIALSAKPASLQ